MTIIVATGTQSQKLIGGRPQAIEPWAGADRSGTLASFGVGFDTLTGSTFWGLLVPRLLIRSWRAMKILEGLPAVNSSTLCACWYAANPSSPKDEEKYLDLLERMFETDIAFTRLRQNVLSQVPTDEEITSMLIQLKAAEIEVDTFELTQLVKDGLIQPNPLIDELVETSERKHQEYQAREEWIYTPFPADESLGQLFTNLGITSMLAPDDFGWRTLHPDQLDKDLKYFTTGEFGTNYLLRREVGGRPCEPVHMVKGVTFTFKTAVVRDGKIMITTTIERLGAESITEEYSVGELRAMLSINEKRQPWWKRFTR